MVVKILSLTKGYIVYKKDGHLNEFKLFKKKGMYELKKRNTNAHKTTLRILIIEEEKKRNKLNNDPTYNPSDKHIFLNDIDIWRICCYNHIGVI